MRLFYVAFERFRNWTVDNAKTYSIFVQIENAIESGRVAHILPVVVLVKLSIEQFSWRSYLL
jgi:hypothetical protein